MTTTLYLLTLVLPLATIVLVFGARSKTVAELAIVWLPVTLGALNEDGGGVEDCLIIGNSQAPPRWGVR
jgi:hypothetical protein